MANESSDARAAAGFSVAATIASVMAYLNSRKVAAGDIVIPDEVVQLLIAMAATSEEIKAGVQEIARILAETGLSVQAWPANADSITASRVAIAPATGAQMPYLTVPSGMTLVIKAYGLNPAWLWVGATAAEASNVNQAFPLLPNEIVTYQVENADQIWIAAMTPAGVATAGCFACLTVEQRRRGGG